MLAVMMEREFPLKDSPPRVYQLPNWNWQLQSAINIIIIIIIIITTCLMSHKIINLVIK
jgi:hypothetical protein